MILCGWCAQPTEPGPACQSCGRDPALPYSQRGQQPTSAIKADLARARRVLGRDASVARIAEYLGVSERTIGRWQQKAE